MSIVHLDRVIQQEKTATSERPECRGSSSLFGKFQPSLPSAPRRKPKCDLRASGLTIATTRDNQLAIAAYSCRRASIGSIKAARRAG